MTRPTINNMPLMRRRRPTTRRRPLVRRRRFARYTTRRAMVRKVHTFKETVQVSTLAAAGASTGSGIIYYKIDDLTNWSHFQGLFDLYKITAVKVKLVPKFNVSDTGLLNASGAMGSLPMLYIAPNRDPYVPAPTNAADVLNDDGCKIIRLTKPINLFLTSPKAAITNAAGPIAMQFGASRKFQPWLATGGNAQTVDQSAVAHYGHRWFIANGSGNQECDVDVYVTYYFQMKEQD